MSRVHKHTSNGIDGRTCDVHETRVAFLPSGGAAGREKERFALLLYILDGRCASFASKPTLRFPTKPTLRASIGVFRSDVRVVALRSSSALEGAATPSRGS